MGTHDHRALLLAVNMCQNWMSRAPAALKVERCVPGRTAVFHRQDMVANSTVIFCAVFKQHRFIPVYITRCVCKFFMGLALQAVLDCLVKV